MAATPDTSAIATTGASTAERPPCGVGEIWTRERSLPSSVGELRANWRQLPPTITVDELLESGWLSLTRAPLYRAIARGDLPAVRLGRRTLILTVPLLRLLGIDLDRPAARVSAGQASSQACSPPDVHDVDAGEML